MKYVGEYAGTNEKLAAGVLYQSLRVTMMISIPLAAFIFLGSGLLAQAMLGTATQAGLFMVLAVDVLIYA